MKATGEMIRLKCAIAHCGAQWFVAAAEWTAGRRYLCPLCLTYATRECNEIKTGG